MGETRLRDREKHTEKEGALKPFKLGAFLHCLISTIPPFINSLITHFPTFQWWWHTGVISAEVEKVLILDVGPLGAISDRTAHYCPDRLSHAVNGSQWSNSNTKLLRVGKWNLLVRPIPILWEQQWKSQFPFCFAQIWALCFRSMGISSWGIWGLTGTYHTCWVT